MSTLTPETVNNLPMFNILDKNAGFPKSTIFGNSAYFQAQEQSTRPRRNTQCPNGKEKKVTTVTELTDEALCWDGYYNV